jgi:hypothetical protein
VLRIIGV